MSSRYWYGGRRGGGIEEGVDCTGMRLLSARRIEIMTFRHRLFLAFASPFLVRRRASLVSSGVGCAIRLILVAAAFAARHRYAGPGGHGRISGSRLLTTWLAVLHGFARLWPVEEEGG